MTEVYKPTGLAATIFKERYTIHPDESWEEASNRLARHVASAETDGNRQRYASEFYEEIVTNKFMPGGRIWYGADRNRAQLLNCVTGETIIHTSLGAIEAKNLVNKEIGVLTQTGRYHLAKWYAYGKQPVFKVILNNGDEIRTTEKHEWVVTKPKGGTERLTTDKIVGKKIPYQHREVFIYDETDYTNGVKHGLTFGDGSIISYGTSSELRQFGDSKEILYRFFDNVKEKTYAGNPSVVTKLPVAYKSLPTGTESQSYMRGFLAGWIGADGHVDKRGHVMLHSANYENLVKMREWAAACGLPSTSLKEVRHLNPWTKEVAPLYKLSFIKAAMYDDHMIIKQTHKDNMFNSPKPNKRATIKVINIIPDGIEEVYCCVEPDTHTMVVGNGYLTGQCFVVPTSDSREGWGKTIHDVIVVSGMGGGVGINCSPIRPRGSKINGTGGVATGAVSLMNMINSVGDELVSGGGRRLALMLDLNISHPDMPEFIDAKLNKNKLTNANVSVIIDKKINTETFVSKVKNNEDFDLVFGGTASKKVNAKDLWQKIVQNAWNSGEPGVLNGDLANRESNIWYHKPLVSTNPCGEIWLEEYGCCDLGALVLPRFVNANGDFDYAELAKTVRTAVRFLDNVLSVNEYPLPEIRDNCMTVRRIGLGIMGLHSMLIKMGHRYSSDSAIEFVDYLMGFIKEQAYLASIDLAKEKGPFPAFDAELFLQSGFIQRAINPVIQERIREHGIRNCALLTIAPTGTTGMVSNVSTGIEPLFSAAYWRRFYRPTADGSRQLDKELVVDPLWDEVSDISILEGAYDVPPDSHFKMQVACQKHIDNATSKTINLPQNYSVEALSDLWLQYLPLVKGTTFYRAGSRGEEPLEAIPLSEAKQLLSFKQQHSIPSINEQNMMDCVGDSCGIPEELKPHIMESPIQFV